MVGILRCNMYFYEVDIEGNTYLMKNRQRLQACCECVGVNAREKLEEDEFCY